MEIGGKTGTEQEPRRVVHVRDPEAGDRRLVGEDQSVHFIRGGEAA
ncbi:MAG: hypothetical protein ACLRMJ_11370 [Alistipes finegoldii]